MLFCDKKSLAIYFNNTFLFTFNLHNNFLDFNQLIIDSIRSLTYHLYDEKVENKMHQKSCMKDI